MEDEDKINQIVESKRSIKKHQAVTDCYEIMCQTAVHGETWSAKWLADKLQCKVNTRMFGLRLAAVNRQLEMDMGYHLTSRGKNGLHYFIEDIKITTNTIKKMQSNAIEQLGRAAIYGNAALREHGNKLNDMQRYKLEKEIEIAAKRHILALSIKSIRKQR